MLKEKWELGHIEMKQATHRKGCRYGYWSSVHGCYFDGTKIRKRYLRPDIRNAFLNVETSKQAILCWLELKRLRKSEEWDDDNLAAWTI